MSGLLEILNKFFLDLSTSVLMRCLLQRLLFFGISIIYLQNKSGNTLTFCRVRTFKSILITSNERYKYEILIVCTGWTAIYESE